jgi:hypothetical protein
VLPTSWPRCHPARRGEVVFPAPAARYGSELAGKSGLPLAVRLKVVVLIYLRYRNAQQKLLKVGNLHVLLVLLTERAFQGEHKGKPVQQVRLSLPGIFSTVRLIRRDAWRIYWSGSAPTII